MAIVYDPKELVETIAPKAKVERLVSGRVGLKRTALSFLTGIQQAGDIAVKIDKRAVSSVALKTIKGYKSRIKADSDVKDEILDDPKQLVQRVQNEIIFQVHEKIKTQYKGQTGRWLPSSAEEPRPLHAKYYGQTYVIGEGLPAGDNGEMVEPGDEWGCQCGVEILTDETQLELD